MDIKVLAFVLLLFRLGAVGFIIAVLWKQYKLLKYDGSGGMKKLRYILFGLSVVILLGQFVPIFIDYLTVVSELERSVTSVNPVGIAYAFSNAITAMLSALLIWWVYRSASRGGNK